LIHFTKRYRNDIDRSFKMGSHVIVGGGIAGLSTAFYLLKQPSVKRIVVLESSSRLGGWIDTTRNKDGTIYEHGPRTVRPVGPQGANTLQMIEELGLVDSVRSIRYGHPSTTNRMILKDGKLHKLPADLISQFKKLPPFQSPLAYYILKEILRPAKNDSDVSLYEFINRRFGEDVANYAVDPLVRGICAGNSREISVHFIAKYLHQLEQKHNSIVKGYLIDWLKYKINPEPKTAAENCDIVKQARSEHWSVWGLENGLTTLTERLSEYLAANGVEIFTDYNIDDIKISNGSCILQGDSTLTCDHLTLALPAFNAANLTSGINGELSSTLGSIPFVDVGVVNLMYKGNILKNEAFGFLVPSNQPDPILGCIFDTCSFRQGNRTILTLMMGGAWFKQLFQHKSKEEMVDIGMNSVSKILGITQTPMDIKAKVLRQCIAQYTVGHLERVAKARQIINQEKLPLSLVGSSYDGVGINDTILSARRSVLH